MSGTQSARYGLRMEKRQNRIALKVAEKLLVSAQEDLRDVEQACRQKLVVWLGSSENAASSYEHVLDTVLRQIGLGVHRVAVNSFKEESINLYFWPGYERLLGDKGRTTFANPGSVGAVDIQSGIGCYGPRRTYAEHPSALWYSLLLTPFQGKGNQFYPGSTHRWLNEWPDPRVQPSALIVELVNAPKRARICPDLVGTAVRVELQHGQVVQRAETLQRLLSKPVKLRTKLQRLPPWPYVTGSDSVAANTLRMLAYDVWLLSCFDPLRSMDAGILDTITSQLEEITEDGVFSTPDSRDAYLEFLHEGFRNGRANKDLMANASLPAFVGWYSVPLTAPIAAVNILPTATQRVMPDLSLGTAMFLSSRKLSGAFLEITSAWVRMMYSALRDFERQAQARNLGQANIASAFGHEVGKLGRGMLDSFQRPILEFCPSMATDAQLDPPARSWADPPFSIVVPEEWRSRVATWRICPVPFLMDGLTAMFDAWGSVRTVDRKSRTLSAILDELGREAKSVAAGRLLVEEAPAFSIEALEELQRKFDTAQRLQAAFSISDSAATIAVDPVNGLRRYVDPAGGSHEIDSFAFLRRALLALMSNAVYHARKNTTIEAKASIKQVEAIQDPVLVVELHNVPSDEPPSNLVQSGAERSYYAVSSKAVALACLQPIGGIVMAFPHSDDARAVTRIAVPVRSGGEGVPWIRFC